MIKYLVSLAFKNEVYEDKDLLTYFSTKYNLLYNTLLNYRD